MDQLEPFGSLGVALALGLLVGFEREQSAAEKVHPFPGGARTFPLVALLGAVCSMLAERAGYVLVLVVGLALSGFLLLSYWDDVRKERNRGLTSEVAFLLTYVLGALATSRGLLEPTGHRAVVLLAVAVVATVILSLKPRLHAFARETTRDDILAVLKFLVVAVVVMPLLPDRTMDPLGTINPFKVGWMVVLIAGIGFVGYVAVRALGPGKGLGLTGLVGGLVSSTAVTLSFSGRARREPELAPSCALAIISASSIMFGRVLVEVGVVHFALVRPLLLPLGAMAVAGALASAYFFRRAQISAATTGELDVQNPFELSSALKFGALFVAVLFLSKLATTHLGQGGTYLAGVLAGTTDVDAITLSMANLAREGLDPTVAVTTIILGTASNTMVKAGVAVVIGGWAFGRRVLLAFVGILSAGALGVLALWWG
ncbi:MAG: MgtC/SapB family protein [Myxococcota bacterium]